MLKYLASVYDPLGIASPIMLTGKLLFRDTCDQKLSWDYPLEKGIKNKYLEWMNALPERIEILRSIPQYREKAEWLDLHVFADASGKGVSAALYAVVNQHSGVSQGLLASKCRLAKKNASIPRLELIACYLAAILLDNAKGALRRVNIRKCMGWTDSTVALHWIRTGKILSSSLGIV